MAVHPDFWGSKKRSTVPTSVPEDKGEEGDTQKKGEEEGTERGKKPEGGEKDETAQTPEQPPLHVAKELLLFCEELVKDQNLISIRADAYEQNVICQKFLTKKMGFTQVGTFTVVPEDTENWDKSYSNVFKNDSHNFLVFEKIIKYEKKSEEADNEGAQKGDGEDAGEEGQKE